MNKFYPLIFVCMFTMIILSGCLFPQDELSKNKVPNEAQLDMVQTAVEQYKEETDGLVPIKTKENDVDQYQKYVIDFSLLKERQLLSEIPGTAYENGGVYQYTMVTPEDDPRVKLIDLRISQKVQELNRKIDIYRSKNMYPPFGKQVGPGVYQINYKKLGYQEEPYIVSPFSNENLPLVFSEEGEVFVDYRIDLRKALEEYDHDFQEGDDIRPILDEHFPFVPVYSLPYTVENGDPIFLDE